MSKIEIPRNAYIAIEDKANITAALMIIDNVEVTEENEMMIDNLNCLLEELLEITGKDIKIS